MSLALSVTEHVARARADLRLGVPIVMGGKLVFAAETISPERFATLQESGAEIVLAITTRRAETLKARA